MDQSGQRNATPLLLSNRGEPAKELKPVPENDPLFREGRLQELLVDHPSVLPVSEIEPAYAPLICLGAEISIPSGFLDVLYVSSTGYPTLVETKMWDNPEARRKVIGQIVEYAKDLSRWGFDDLNQAVQEADESGIGILDRVRREGHDIDPSSFIDTVTRKLRRGEFLLLVVGNGIRENLKSLTSYLQGAPDLHFSLRLVELAQYRFESEQDWPLFVQPRVVARTSEVTRAVVDVRTSGDDVEVTVDLPNEDEEESSGRRTLTESAFYEQLTANTSTGIAEEVRTLVEEITDLGPIKKWGASSVSLRFPDPGGADKLWTVVVLQTDGQFTLGWLNRVTEDGGYDPKIWKSYLDGAASLTGANIKEGGTDRAPIQNLLEHREEYIDLVREFVDRIRAAADSAHGT